MHCSLSCCLLRRRVTVPKRQVVIPQPCSCPHNSVVKPTNLVPELVCRSSVALHTANSVLGHYSEMGDDVILLSFRFRERSVLSTFLGNKGIAAWRTLLLKTLESGVCPNTDITWYVFAEQLSVGESLVMTSARFGGRNNKDTFVLVTDDDVFSGVSLLLAGVGTLVGFAVSGALDRSLGAINETILYLRKLLNQLFHGADFPLWELDLFAQGLLEYLKIEMGCFTGTTRAFAVQATEYVESWISLDVKQDKEQLG